MTSLETPGLIFCVTLKAALAPALCPPRPHSDTDKPSSPLITSYMILRISVESA
eukprot:CAMPEP_0183318178 /NCGR_PEP_ID=MMETSP0160_2-20130417/59940_1 /TAXON_ID=2839 ORGANISM="Odontella Sinensis, Strain Grunow 1884" /NCGR_SAMPLE_ID=MMETSP0160_2 /ASSEMBLY_ACC=CAM_ASM_000250 /LENGTH=53 /DNA_ID=CAMNT_0025484365 /DNA_START=202 /DNA_END=359 /DNA_ORIENTATION=+